MAAPGFSPDFLHTTRTSYDTMAPVYVEFARGELAAKPLERALLRTFAELAAAGGGNLPVADVGCGTGRVTAHLHELGLGLDLFCRSCLLPVPPARLPDVRPGRAGCRTTGSLRMRSAPWRPDWSPRETNVQRAPNASPRGPGRRRTRT